MDVILLDIAYLATEACIPDAAIDMYFSSQGSRCYPVGQHVQQACLSGASYSLPFTLETSLADKT